MQLTRAADYAVRVMIHLAGLPAGACVSHSELAAAVECPKQFLAKVLQRLTRAGLIVSRRGSVGGFELPPSGRRASMLDVIEAIEGPVKLNVCLTSPDACSRRQNCPAHAVWARGQAALVAVLRSAVIEELALDAAAIRETRNRLAEGPAWN